MILPGGFWILKIGQKRSQITFSSEVFERCANKLVWYLFETLPVTTRFKPEPMIFLIDVNFRKGSKIGTKLPKIKKDTFVAKSMRLIPLFSPIAFWIPYCSNAQVIGSSIRQKFSWFEQWLRFICQTTCFFVVSWLFGCIWCQFQPKI